MFNENQESFIRLKKILAENTAPVYLWLGSGLSVAAGFPAWKDLRDKMVKIGANVLSLQANSDDKHSREWRLKVAETYDDLWKAFSMVEDAIGKFEYEKAICSVFQSAVDCKVPENYKKIFSLNIKGVITTNIDKLVTRAYYDSTGYLDRKGQTIIEFTGKDCGSYGYVLTAANSFILHLHGHYENMNSLIMRREEIDELSRNVGYTKFIENLFFGRVVVFIGVNPMDDSVVQHLKSVRSQGMHSAPMFWITSSNDEVALKFADEYGISRIIYSADNGHEDLGKVLDLLKDSESVEEEIKSPVFPHIPLSTKGIRNFQEIDFTKLSNSEARDLLNKKAHDILKSGTPDSYARYQKFLAEYGRAVHNAWFVCPGEELLGLRIKKEIDDGAFGRVFLAEEHNGDWVAVKLLKSDLMRKPECLQSFRRGVRAMEILSRAGVNGVVKYKFASEIPAFVAMEYIDGENLNTLVEQRQIVTWSDKMRVLSETAKIIKTAHALPERVLHRDIRPQNIMLKGYDYATDDWSVCVLDFDLAFHKGANEVSMQMATGINGFLAPEQTNPSGRYGTTRSSRVDSYGFAMLCYYVITGMKPRPEQCLQSGWRTMVYDNICKHRCEDLVSLPYEMARIIEQCTMSDQNARMDLYKVYGYLSSLEVAMHNNDDIRIPELKLDEVACLIAKEMNGNIMVSVDSHERRIVRCRTGQEIMLYIDQEHMHLHTSWYNPGNGDYARVKKSIGELAESLVRRLHNSGFSATHRFEGAGVVVEIEYDLSKALHSQHEELAGLLNRHRISPKAY